MVPIFQGLFPEIGKRIQMLVESSLYCWDCFPEKLLPLWKNGSTLQISQNRTWNFIPNGEKFQEVCLSQTQLRFYEFWTRNTKRKLTIFDFFENSEFFNFQRMSTSKIFVRRLSAGKMWYQEILECWIWPMNQILIGWTNIQSDSI